MQPQSPSKPVMDVKAPRSPQPSTTPMELKPAPPSTPAPAFRPAPLGSAPNRTQSASPKKESLSPQPASTAPVGVITAAVLVMMFMSAMAVVVYMTSQS